MRLTATQFGQAVAATNNPQWRQLQRAAKSYDGRLTHITSGPLCDDVLSLLKATLPPPHTCDIVDLNPGPCLWSQKLNDLVQPRRHILVEPRRSTFANYIDPLLAKRNSSYRYAASVDAALDPKEKLLSQDTYQFRKKLKETQRQQFAHNEDLLITANLSGTARKVIGFTGSEAKQFLNDYYRSIFVREDFLHQYGLVRLLAWVGGDARIPIMPTTVNSRTKQSVQLETTCTVDQVAGPSQFRDLYPHQRRWYDLDVGNQQEIRKRQKRLGIAISPQRDQPNPILPFVALDPTVKEVRKNKDLYPYNQVYIKRLLELDNQLSTEEPDWYAQYQAEASHRFQDFSKYGRKEAPPPKHKAYRIYMTQLRTHHNTYLKSKDFIWEQRQLVQKFQRAWDDGWFSPVTGLPVEGQHEKEAKKLIEEDQFMHKQRQSIKTDTRGRINKSGDDYRCVDSDPQILAWNRRRHEPLLVRDDEFFPNNPMTLYDFKPNSDVPLQLSTIDKQICYDHVCTLLMTNPGDTVLRGIKRLVPAGYDQFLERLPELRNAKRGGWWNLDHIRIRALHHDYFVAIALAFHDWPHRPPIEKLMAIHRGVFEEVPR